GDRGPGRGAEERAALHLAVLVRLRECTAGAPVAARRELRAAAVPVRGRVRAAVAGAGLAARPAGGAGRPGRGGDRVHLPPDRRLHAPGDALLEPEGPGRQLLQAAALAGRTAAGLADVLARRELLHAERDL